MLPRYFALDGSTLATNEVALRSLYEVLRRHRNAAGLAPERLGLAAALCAALSHEWLRFAPTAVTVAAAVLARLAAAGGGDALRLDVARVVALLACAAADRDVAYDTFGSVRDARAFAAEHGGCDVVTCFSASDEATHFAGQQKRAKFPTSKAPISAVSHSFRLTFGRAIISWNGLAAWMLLSERARAEHSR